MKDRYEIKSRIGIGGHGVIYEAFDTQMQRKVAIKRINNFEGPAAAEGEKSFRRETQTLGSLSHPNIIKIFDADSDEDGFYLVMELLKGETLMDFVKEHKPVKLAEFHEFAVQALDALTAARQVNILHRDIKATNLFLDRTPAGRLHVTLLDFGLAKFAEHSDEQTRSADETVMGSVHFMAPEQFEMLPLDHRTDLYSLGVCCYYMLTGLYPFDGESAPLIMAAHLQHRKIPLEQRRPDLPRAVTDWVHHLIARKPEERPNGSMEALSALRALKLKVGEGDSGPEVAKSPKTKIKGKSRAKAASAMVMVGALSSLATFLLVDLGEDGPDSRVRQLFGQFFAAVNAPDAAPADPEAVEAPVVMPSTEPVSLPELTQWTSSSTEPGSGVVEDKALFSPMDQSEGSVRMEDGVGANLFPALSYDLGLVKASAARWSFDFRIQGKGLDGKIVMEESWGATLRDGPEGKPVLDLRISPKDLTIMTDGDSEVLPIIPERWYRLEVALNLVAGTQSGTILDLEHEGLDPRGWKDLRLPPNKGVIGSIRFHDRSEKSYRPNHSLNIDNVRLELAVPTAE